MSAAELLPIRVVVPRFDDNRPVPAGGGSTVFVPVNAALRNKLSNEITEVQSYFREPFRQMNQSGESTPAVASVRLRPDAVAKSHRPSDLFTPDTCPIIGGNALGELFVSVRPDGLQRLGAVIERGETRTLKANISTIESIQPYRREDALEGGSLAAVENATAKAGRPLKVRLFRFGSPADDAAVEADFRRRLTANNIRDVARMEYADGLRVYRIQEARPERIARLSQFVGIRSMSAFPGFEVVKTASHPLHKLCEADFPRPDDGREYPLVGLIDTGTDPLNPFLKPWVVARYEKVPRSHQNNSHGTFVAGMLVHGKRLNHNHDGFPEASAMIVDVVAIEGNGLIQEDQLVFLLDEVLLKFSKVRVWNLSLSLRTTHAAT